MSGIKSRNTRPELEIRKKLFSLGYRYRLNVRLLPGCPDIVLSRYKAAIFVHGCFWHAHGCRLFKMPLTHTEFWENKLARNKEKDKENMVALKKLGWRTLVIWECSFRVPRKLREQKIDSVAGKTVQWLHSTKQNAEIRGAR